MNIIWTKDELKKIKAIILNKTNLRIDEIDNTIISKNTKSYQEIYKQNEIEKLFYLSDREEIKETLELINPLKEMVKNDPNNKIYLGFLTSLSKIDPKDPTEIFTIYKEILSQYSRLINEVLIKFLKNVKEEDAIKVLENKISKLINTSEEPEEERYIKSEINKLLSYTNGIEESNIFMEIFERCNKDIKNNLIKVFRKKLSYYVSKNLKDINNILFNYDSDRKEKYARSHGQKCINRMRG